MNKNTKPLLILSILGTVGSLGYIVITAMNELTPRPGAIPGNMNDANKAGKSQSPEAKQFNFSLDHDPFANSVATVASNVLPNGQILSRQGDPNMSVNFPQIPQSGNASGIQGGINPALPQVMPGQVTDQSISINGVEEDQMADGEFQQVPDYSQVQQNPYSGTNQMVNQPGLSNSPNGEITQQPGASNAPRTTFPKIVLKGIVEGSETVAYLEISGSKSKAFSVGSRPLSGVVIKGMTSTSVELTYLGESISLKVGQEVELK
jgi:hypothetical protein